MPVLGFLLVGASAVLSFHLHRKLQAAGEKNLNQLIATTKLTNYTGVVILALVAPIYFLFLYLGYQDIGLTVALSVGMIMLAVRIRWDLRKHAWFWAVIT